MTLQQKALRTIEGLTELWENGEKTVERAEKLMGSIFKYSHIAVGRCENPHNDWKEEMEKDYQQLKKHKLI